MVGWHHDVLQGLLRTGFASMPSADVQVRAQIESIALEQGWQAIHKQAAPKWIPRPPLRHPTQ